MIGPFVMVAMCDCHFDDRLQKKVCTPFLRAFSYGCDGVKVIGDYDHNGQIYTPRGEVSSEAKCCDCGCDDEKPTKVCYDLACLIRPTERNGGLENISIMGGDGIAGPVVHFLPPATSIQEIANKLNAMSYLGLNTWQVSSEKKGFLCVDVAKGGKLPGNASGNRFRRFLATDLNGGFGVSLSKQGYSTTTTDSVAAGSPGVTPNVLMANNIHYYCNVGIKVNGLGSTVAKAKPNGVLEPKNLYRMEFPNTSSNHYHLDYSNPALPWVVTDPSPTLPAGRPIWAANLARWLEYSVRTGLTFGSTLAYQNWPWSATSVHPSVDAYYGQLAIDVPSNVEVNDAFGIQINGVEMDAAGNPIGGLPTHRKTFAEVVGVGHYESKPYIDGVGGGTSWAANCAIPGPFRKVITDATATLAVDLDAQVFQAT